MLHCFLCCTTKLTHELRALHVLSISTFADGCFLNSFCDSVLSGLQIGLTISDFFGEDQLLLVLQKTEFLLFPEIIYQNRHGGTTLILALSKQSQGEIYELKARQGYSETVSKEKGVLSDANIISHFNILKESIKYI